MVKTYIEKLKDPRWQKMRLQVLNRDDFQCKSCESKEKTLHVHHCGYDKEITNPWEYPKSWLITLCEDCHADETEFLKDIKNNFLKDLCSYGFISEDYYCLSDVLLEALRRGMKPRDIMPLILEIEIS